MKMKMSVKLWRFATAALAGLTTAPAIAKDADDEPVFRHWYVRAGPADVIYDEGAKISIGGSVVPGASLRVKDNFTGEIEVGYFFNPNVAVSLTAGVPPTATLIGTGPLEGVKLGKVTYGPAVASIHYHFTNFGPLFQPYVGPGINYTIVFNNRDGAVQNLKINSAVGIVLQGGFESRISDRIGLFVDAKKIFLDTNGRGFVGEAPVAASIKVNPLIVSGGLSFHF